VFAARLIGRPLSALPPGGKLHALSGIADPGAFERSLVRQGYVVTGATRFADHHAFQPDEVREAARLAGDQGADHLAVTAKDHVRWPDEEGLPVPAVFDLDVEVIAADALLAVVDRHCAGEAA
jgi:tetraacyldisaccharide 4'-kinase